ncbi:Inhibitor I9 domain-containing protein [Madurella fahalii]|uniref:Inhibitor I9 domain-containing protein n=1 Tax=Madurella fahalii TaxID=1157608 RepID=A0ABQ0GLN7_9PEZI
MPSYIVTCKEDATEEQVQALKQQVKDQGGQIGHEYTLIKGFQAIYPEGSVQALAGHEHVQDVELDAEVKTQ